MLARPNFTGRKRRKFPPRGAAGNRGELKFFDYDQQLGPATPIPTGGVIIESIMKIGAGTGEAQRIGRKITLKSVHMNWQILVPSQVNETFLPDGDLLRIIVYLDSQANGTAATVTGILENGNINAFRNLSDSTRFRILSDTTRPINHTTFSSVVNNSNSTRHASLDRWIHFSNHKNINVAIEYSGDGTSIDTIRSNNIGVLLISKTGQTFTTILKSRIRFTDL